MSKPAWFHRLHSLARTRQAASGISYWDYLSEDLPLEPEDYDQDLSELSSLSCHSDNGCEYDSDDECTRHGDGDESDSSDSSCVSDLDMDYHHMRRQRKERKRHFRELQKAQQGPKKEEDAINEIKDAIAEAQKKKTLEPLEPFGKKGFQLYSLDHIKHCPDNSTRTRFISFGADEDFHYDVPLKGDETLAVVHMNRNLICEVDQFTPPKFPGIKKYHLSATTENRTSWRVEMQFIDNHHITLKIGADLVCAKAGKPIPADAPGYFKYYGVCTESKKAEEQRKGEQASRSSA